MNDFRKKWLSQAKKKVQDLLSSHEADLNKAEKLRAWLKAKHLGAEEIEHRDRTIADFEKRKNDQMAAENVLLHQFFDLLGANPERDDHLRILLIGIASVAFSKGGAPLKRTPQKYYDIWKDVEEASRRIKSTSSGKIAAELKRNPKTANKYGRLSSLRKLIDEVKTSSINPGLYEPSVKLKLSDKFWKNRNVSYASDLPNLELPTSKKDLQTYEKYKTFLLAFYRQSFEDEGDVWTSRLEAAVAIQVDKMARHLIQADLKKSKKPKTEKNETSV